MLILAVQVADNEGTGSVELGGWGEGVSSGAAGSGVASGIGSLKVAGWGEGGASGAGAGVG